MSPKRKEQMSLVSKRYYRDHKEKVSLYNEEWKKKNPDKIKEIRRRSSLAFNYGLSLEDYNILFEEQEGRCAICGRHQIEFSKSLHVDHCHTTGKIRGLLCGNCNLGLGKFKDDVDLLSNAIKYIVGVEKKDE